MSRTRIIKVVEKGDEQILVSRTLDEIQSDELPIPEGSVVLVLFSDAQEGIEKSLWCYAHNCVPFMGDVNNIAVTLVSAALFRTNILLCDSVLLTEAGRESVPPSVQSVVVVDKFSNFEFPENIKKRYKCSYVSVASKT